MINCKELYNLLTSNGIDFFTGVPDSLLKDFCAYVTDNCDSKKNIITANEGGAIALASGYHLATGKIGLVYMQNSGEGNAVNPLTSLADPEVYSIPLLMLIGWRGEPGKKDEPQHIKQGKVTLPLLETLGIPFEVLPDSLENAQKSLQKAIASIKEKNMPYALVIRKGTFEPYKSNSTVTTNFALDRENALKLVVDQLDEKDIIVSTTGKTSRELFEYRELLKQDHNKEFLTVGSMGHSSQIALGIALQKPQRQVYCFDGDGAVIMHMGSLAIIAQLKPANFKHIIFNNGVHDSVGGQPTAGFNIDIPGIAKANGYALTLKAETAEEIIQGMKSMKDAQGPVLLEIKVNKGSRKDLGRPTTTPIENKNAFMQFLKE